MFIREVHKLDQSAFMGKVRTSQQDDLDESLFDEHVKEEQSRVENLKLELEAKKEELEELISEVPLTYIRDRSCSKRPPKKHRAAVTLYRQLTAEIDELVSTCIKTN